MEKGYTLTLEGKKSHFHELHMSFCGHSVCYPDNSIGPAAHPCYVLHYILDGKGQYQVDGRTYSLGKNQGFLIEPNVMSSYRSDHEDPWTYLWIGFEGSTARTLLEAMGFSHQSLTYSANCGSKLLKIVTAILKSELDGLEQELYLQAQLFQFFSCLSHDLSTDRTIFRSDKQNYYVRAAEEFIREHYTENITVQDIADAVEISRSYLSTLFQTVLHTSPSEYLADFRLTRAHEQLGITDDPVSKIAENCGYQNPLVFTRAFKKKVHVTPSQYRKSIREERKINIQQIQKQ